MDVPVKQLVSEFVAAVTVPESGEEEDVFLQGLVDDFQSNSALFKRDIRRRLEKDPPEFLRSACRILKARSKGPGAEYLMEVLWSNPVLEQMLKDSSPHARSQALRALIRIRKRQRMTAGLAESEPEPTPEPDGAHEPDEPPTA